MRPPLLLLAMSLALLLAPAPARAAGTGTVSGVATWAGGAPGVGVEVEIDPVVPDGQAFTSQEAITDAQGRWQSPLLPAGAYYLVFVVQDSAGSNWTVATEQVSVGAAPQSIATVLEGGPANPIGFGTLAGTVRYPGGFIVPGGRILLGRVGSGELPRDVSLDAGGHYSLVVPAGRYELSFEDTFGALDAAAPARAQAAVSAGATSELDLGLSALAIARGSSASHSARDLRYLNDERAAWGLPAGIVENPLWSQACASHDAYQSRNHLLAHPEDPGRPGYSPGGHWAGTHSVLSMGGGSWTRGANPWEDAPIHLVQLFTPDLGMTGIDESRDRACTTTWPGIHAPRVPAGTVFTYPGDGTRGLPPSEDARELPLVPGDVVGIPEGTVAGRELFVYEEGTTGAPVIASASLVDAAGHRARVKWVDAASHRVAGYLTGAIVIPVSPLKPFTRYTATVALAANDDVGPVRHVWSFTTGARNPGGTWATTAARPRLTRLRMSHRRFRVGSRRSAFRFHLSEPAAVRIMLARVTHRRGGAVGRLVRRRVRGGSRKIPFSGRLGSRALRPGRYRAVATAIAHGRVSAPRSVTFRIVR